MIFSSMRIMRSTFGGKGLDIDGSRISTDLY